MDTFFTIRLYGYSIQCRYTGLRLIKKRLKAYCCANVQYDMLTVDKVKDGHLMYVRKDCGLGLGKNVKFTMGLYVLNPNCNLT